MEKNTTKKELRVTRNDDCITIHRMNHPSCVSSFLRALQRGIAKGYRAFSVEWVGDLVFPDACVPIAGIIAYYKENQHIDFSYILSEDSYQN